jgi:hypothetical protein
MVLHMLDRVKQTYDRSLRNAQPPHAQGRHWVNDPIIAGFKIVDTQSARQAFLAKKVGSETFVQTVLNGR